MEDEEEILAEEQPMKRSLIFSHSIALVMSIIERYGWFLIIGFVVIYCVWRRWLAPQWQAISHRKSAAEYKKFDEKVDEAYADRIQAARRRLQEQYTVDAQRYQEKEEEKQQEKLRRDLERLAKQTGVDLGQAVQAKETKKRSSSDPMVFVQNLINSRPLVVFSKTTCPFSRKAKQALSTYRLPSDLYEIVELDQFSSDEWRTAIQKVLGDLTGGRTVPRVFIGGRFIGGGDETVTLHRSGELERMLRQAGVIP